MKNNPDIANVLFLINPASGIHSKHNVIKHLQQSSRPFNYRMTEYPGHIKELFNKEKSNYDLFVAVGGDGTLNELVSVAVNTEKLIAVLPYGSGNGFAREFGFKKNLKRLLRDIEKGEFLLVDCLRVNDRYSVNTAGVGFDSKIAHIFHNMRKRGFWSYFFSTLKTIVLVKSIDASIKTNKEDFTGRFMLITAANNKQYGNSAIIAPKANPFDGKFDLVLFRPFPKILFPYFAVNVFLGSLQKSKYVEFVQGLDYVQIETDFTQYHIDGEALEMQSPVHISIVPNSLKVLKTRKFR